MFVRPCPTCRNEAHLWLNASQLSIMNYYRCLDCGCIWTIPKKKPDDPPNIMWKGEPKNAR